jgi:hypothetical protein
MSLRPSYPVCTDRLHLRPLSERDGTAFLSYHSIPEVHQYLPMEPMDAEGVAARLNGGPWSRSTLEEEGEMLFLGVELISTGALIGDVMLRWVSAKDSCGERVDRGADLRGLVDGEAELEHLGGLLGGHVGRRAVEQRVDEVLRRAHEPGAPVGVDVGELGRLDSFAVPVNSMTGARSSISPVARVTQIWPSSPVISKNSSAP